ncbi:kinesin-like protein KIF17 [Entelurus aequoreus]|uniref:kinesin-like protein KIF17 n=1 Tax=Entelurus aequoreus TaxID=161455 RepID=UPI002B1E23C7|nr:kinesin-like protein KIF17 [Entelurus aequoreus]
MLTLQRLEQEVVGGEQARNKEFQQRQRQRRKVADQRKAQLVKALSDNSEESDNVLFSVYDSIQEEVHAKGQMLLKVQGKLKAAKLEIRDLQAEFEEERNDYLAIIRRLEREGQLLHGLLERMAPLVRRDCNYSSLDRLKKEAVWDEESITWRLPDVTVQRTTLPTAVAPKLSPPRSLTAETEALVVDDDRYKQMLDRSDSENIANTYFRSKRASQLLGGQTTKGHATYSPSFLNANTSMESAMPRPFRLESLTVPASTGKTRRKKNKYHQ